MKRSEFIAVMTDRYKDGMEIDFDIEADVSAAEFAGVKWDPEEPFEQGGVTSKPDPVADLNARRSQLIIDLTSMKAAAGQLGLWCTMQALDSATTAAGWELADLMSGRRVDSIAKLTKEGA